MTNRLADAVSPYLRAHADNPVDWWPWGEDAFREAERRDVPVIVSIGYATCHWCHVMARESFSDPELAAELNARFVAIKVDREEHPDVDASFMAAAGAFTRQLGWPLTLFTTPAGRPFYAGTYFPPQRAGGMPSFREVLDAIGEAWAGRRADLEATGAAVADALRAQRGGAAGGSGGAGAAGGAGGASAEAPGEAGLADAVSRLLRSEDQQHGGFGLSPKFPVAPVLLFLAERGARGDDAARALAARTFATMAASGLRDPVEGGFFRYATRRDWSEPHYERMLGDNALLLDVATAIGDRETAEGIAGFLLDVLRLPGGAFATAQDSESDVDGVRSEGGYYRLDAAARAAQPRPALDEKVLSGLNGHAVGALAGAGQRFGRTDWVDAAAQAADAVLAAHTIGDDGGGRDGIRIARASRDGAVSDAVATLEDYGGLAAGLLRLALAAGDARHAVTARRLVDACTGPDGELAPPDGPDPVLGRRGLDIDAGLDEGATPSGATAFADAALRLAGLTGDHTHRALAERAVARAASRAVAEPIAFGGALTVAARLAAPLEQLVVVGDGGPDAAALAEVARAWGRPAGVLAVVSPEQASSFADAGFGLFAGRGLRDGRPAAYLCEHFVCALPVTSADDLRELLAARP